MKPLSSHRLCLRSISITASCWCAPPRSSLGTASLSILWTAFPEVGPNRGTPRSSGAPHYHGLGPVTSCMASGPLLCTKLLFMDTKWASYALGPWPHRTLATPDRGSCCPHPCLHPLLFLPPGGDPPLRPSRAAERERGGGSGHGGRKVMSGLFSSETRNIESQGKPRKIF